MPSSAVAGMASLPSPVLCLMVKPMTEIELNEQIERLLTEPAYIRSVRQTGSAYRREMGVRKSDKRMQAISHHYIPRGPFVNWSFDGSTLFHSGYYIKYPRSSKEKKLLKKLTSKRVRRALDLPMKGKQYRRLLDYWWMLD